MTETNATELAAVKAEALAPLSIKNTVLAQFKEAETILTELAERYRNVAYDTATPKGMRDAIAARADLRDNGRLFVTKAEKRIKADVNDLKRVMADEVERLVGIVQPVEESIDKQIKAEEARRAAEKAERERVEALRVSAHIDNIDKLKSYVARAKGQPVDAIERAIEVLSAIQFGEQWEEFASAALEARDRTVEALREMAANERQRLENERLAQELAEANAALAAARAEAEAKAEAERARIREEEQEKARREAEALAEQRECERQAELAQAVLLHRQEAQRVVAENRPALEAAVEKFRADPRFAAVIAGAPSEAPGVCFRDPPENIIEATSGDEPDNEPSLKLGDINGRLQHLSLSAEDMRAFGIAPAARDKRAVLYTEAQFQALLTAISAHVSALARQYRVGLVSAEATA